MLVRLALLLAIAPLLSACAGSMASERVDPAFEAPYTLGAGDKLRVVVFGQDGLSNTYAVDGAGRITMPLIGPVEARGRTTNELTQAIVAKLKAGYIREPHVAVEVEIFPAVFHPWRSHHCRPIRLCERTHGSVGGRHRGRL